MASQDHGYTILLSHLHNPTSKLSLSTIQGALAHFLATTNPLPTPLAATAIASPFYLSQPFTYDKLQSFCTAFRHATHLKYRNLADIAKSRSRLQTLLGRTVQSALGQWVTDVLQGLYGGHPVLRLASCSGLLLGIEDLKTGKRVEEDGNGIDVGTSRFAVEDEVVVALAEVMDTYSHVLKSSFSTAGVEEWEREFQPAGQDILSLALIFSSQTLILVTEFKVRALPLAVLARLLTATISSTFKSGTFLASVSASVTLSTEHKVHIPQRTPLAQTLHSLSSSPLTASIASISKLTAHVLALMIDDPSSSRLNEGMDAISETLDILRSMAKRVEHDWISCPLASTTDADIALDSKEITKSIWITLKTLLFSTIMITEAVLSASIYLPPGSTHTTPASIALQALDTLSCLSFVISEFGGVTTTTQGFEHLKKTFYLALDILAQGDREHGDISLKAETYVQQACFALNSQRAETAAASARQAKQAFVLASIEQLVPVITDKCIRDWVWGICYLHLSDSTHRETYESAHSVILAIFAAHAQQQQQSLAGQRSVEIRNDELEMKYDHSKTDVPEVKSVGQEHAEIQQAKSSPTFVQRMIPFYTKCLIENSADGKLNTPQLRLAFSALVRSATVTQLAEQGTSQDTHALAWFCIKTLLDTIHALAPDAMDSSSANEQSERLHKLHLMLISTISSLPLSLMLYTLDEIRLLITEMPAAGGGAESSAGDRPTKKSELLTALFTELIEKTGDREKEAAIHWWYKYRPALIPEAEEGKKIHGLTSWLSRPKSMEKEKCLQAVKSAGEEKQAESLVPRL